MRRIAYRVRVRIARENGFPTRSVQHRIYTVRDGRLRGKALGVYGAINDTYTSLKTSPDRFRFGSDSRLAGRRGQPRATLRSQLRSTGDFARHNPIYGVYGVFPFGPRGNGTVADRRRHSAAMTRSRADGNNNNNTCHHCPSGERRRNIIQCITLYP